MIWISIFLSLGIRNIFSQDAQRRYLPAAGAVVVAALLTSCAVEVPTPLIPAAFAAEESLEALTPPPAVAMGAAVAFPSKLPALPAAGDKNAFGGVTSAPMAAALGGAFHRELDPVLRRTVRKPTDCRRIWGHRLYEPRGSERPVASSPRPASP